ncbi:hypothetical protein FOL47_005497 [Perkinsus chesapeaki]|uniref:Uncharacterized protein n=1 Tax=Perkinsus chesapeaki TaxID=330153 RepID=A0A7J6LX95_PERCH|nr:hypothetical protein FOL47_005497 [Perkinsus chesapeaki]
MPGWEPFDECRTWHVDKMESYGVRKQARESNVMLVTPCPLSSNVFLSPNIPGWGYNAGTCCNSNTTIDDIGFIREIRDLFRSHFGVSNLPMYAVGFSTGGMLAEALMCYNIISKAASIEGTLTLPPGLDGAFQACDNKFDRGKRDGLSLMKVHQLGDWVVPYDGSPNAIISYLRFPSVEEDISKWAERLGCESDEREKVATIGAATIEKYPRCPHSNSVYLVEVEGRRHRWPGLDCETEDPSKLCTSKAVFDFFHGHPLTR